MSHTPDLEFEESGADLATTNQIEEDLQEPQVLSDINEKHVRRTPTCAEIHTQNHVSSVNCIVSLIYWFGRDIRQIAMRFTTKCKRIVRCRTVADLAPYPGGRKRRHSEAEIAGSISDCAHVVACGEVPTKKTRTRR
jgi:hypothetical protein